MHVLFGIFNYVLAVKQNISDIFNLYMVLKIIVNY